MTDPIYDVKVVHPLATDDSNDSSLSGTPTDSSPSSPPMPSMDEVTTIFVVGFPDDMQEREFQNMFIFSKGFEAASLKWHSKDQQEEQESLFSSLNNKKQMIGFARFKTRQEASDAAKEMNGKKVDVEKGCVLKAEMAKKNLHIKRNSIVPNPNSMLPAAVPLPEPMTSPMMRRLSQQPDIAFSPPQPGGFSPLPSDLLSPGDYKTDPFLNDPFLIAPNTPTISESLFGSHSPSIDIRHSVDMPVNPFNLFSKSFNSDYETDPFNYLSKSSPSSKNDFPFKKTDDFPRKNSLQPHSERSASISLGTFRNNTDQNPPCNTLYVGNLPPASNEDELRSLFSSCEGYKRMSFRQKPQGPMCFVEFEDVVFATQAMSQLQGHVLSNSVKGGIRLSFSKNPLFIKPNKEIELSLGFKQMGTALLADV